MFRARGSITESGGRSAGHPVWCGLSFVPSPNPVLLLARGPHSRLPPSHSALNDNHMQLLPAFWATIREALPWNAPSNHKLYMSAYSMTSLTRKRHSGDNSCHAASRRRSSAPTFSQVLLFRGNLEALSPISWREFCFLLTRFLPCISFQTNLFIAESSAVCSLSQCLSS